MSPPVLIKWANAPRVVAPVPCAFGGYFHLREARSARQIKDFPNFRDFSWMGATSPVQPTILCFQRLKGGNRAAPFPATEFAAFMSAWAPVRQRCSGGIWCMADRK